MNVKVTKTVYAKGDINEEAVNAIVEEMTQFMDEMEIDWMIKPAGCYEETTGAGFGADPLCASWFDTEWNDNFAATEGLDIIVSR